MANKITEFEITKLLAQKHSADMFFQQVKDGPTQLVTSHSKIDALAIRLSWTKFAITGYEIKTSRSDFLRDDKWRAYLPMCNQLYFAVTPGVCEAAEMPEVCGLMQVTASGNGLRTIKKAAFREIEHPVEMYIYLMFTHIGPYWERDAKYPRAERLLPDRKRELFENFINGKTERYNLGQAVSKKLRDDYTKLEFEFIKYKHRTCDADMAATQIKMICDELGIPNDYHKRAVAAIAAIRQLKASGGISLQMIDRIKENHKLAEQLMSDIEPTQDGSKKEAGGDDQ